jgi:hypothetical protein
MAVNVSASGKGGVSLGGNLDLSQLGGSSPAIGSAILFVVLIAIIVMIGLSLR